MDELHFAHVLARVVVEVKVDHHIGPTGGRGVVKPVFDAAHGHLGGGKMSVCVCVRVGEHCLSDTFTTHTLGLDSVA